MVFSPAQYVQFFQVDVLSLVLLLSLLFGNVFLGQAIGLLLLAGVYILVTALTETWFVPLLSVPANAYDLLLWPVCTILIASILAGFLYTHFGTAPMHTKYDREKRERVSASRTFISALIVILGAGSFMTVRQLLVDNTDVILHHLVNAFTVLIVILIGYIIRQVLLLDRSASETNWVGQVFLSWTVPSALFYLAYAFTGIVYSGVVPPEFTVWLWVINTGICVVCVVAAFIYKQSMKAVKDREKLTGSARAYNWQHNLLPSIEA